MGKLFIQQPVMKMLPPWQPINFTSDIKTSLSQGETDHLKQSLLTIMELLRRDKGAALCIFNTLRPRQDGRRFPDDTFERIFLKENVIILIEISLKFVPKGPINNIPALFQIMAWRRSGDKPLSELVMVRLPTHICVTRPQWVNWLMPDDKWKICTQGD